MAELVETYASLRLGGVDASVIAVAERLNVATIATLNRRVPWNAALNRPFWHARGTRPL
jgi:hypothetical protein